MAFSQQFGPEAVGKGPRAGSRLFRLMLEVIIQSPVKNPAHRTSTAWLTDHEVSSDRDMQRCSYMLPGLDDPSENPQHRYRGSFHIGKPACTSVPGRS